MRNVKFVFPLFVLFAMSGMAWGWGGSKHRAMAWAALNDSHVTPLLQEFGLYDSRGSIRDMADDLDYSEWNTYDELSGWGTVRDRGYWYNSIWGNLPETRRMAFLCHMASDSSVPFNHSPAGEYGYNNEAKQACLEAWSETWSLPGMTYYAGNRNDRNFSFLVNDINNASGAWILSYTSYVLGSATVHTVATKGMKYGLSLTESMLVDYFLLQKPVVVEAGGHFGYWALPGGNVTFSSEGSYDPDSVVFNSDGSYYNDGTGLWYGWDINGDGLFDSFNANPTFSYDQIISLVGPSNEWRYFDAWLTVLDDDGERVYQPLNTSEGYDSGILCVAPMNWGVPEPSCLALLATSACGWLFRRRGSRS